MRINNKGVSLPELLAVIVIMGIIAIIAIPAFTSMIENTRKDAVVTEYEELFTRAQTYWIESNGNHSDVTKSIIVDYGDKFDSRMGSETFEYFFDDLISPTPTSSSEIQFHIGNTLYMPNDIDFQLSGCPIGTNFFTVSELDLFTTDCVV